MLPEDPALAIAALEAASTRQPVVVFKASPT